MTYLWFFFYSRDLSWSRIHIPEVDTSCRNLIIEGDTIFLKVILLLL